MADKIEPDNIIYGINPVNEMLQRSCKRLTKIIIAQNKSNNRLNEISKKAGKYGIPIRKAPANKLSLLCRSNNHQGIIGYVSPVDYLNIHTLIEFSFKQDKSPVLLLIDNLEDPRNLGAILRSAAGFEIEGIILIKDRCPGITSTVYKTSAGAVDICPIARVTNSSNTINLLKDKGFTIIGIDIKADISSPDLHIDSPTILVLGGESKGIRRLTLKNCDQIVRIPISKALSSYNVSVAAAIIFYEVSRCRKKP